MSHAPAQSGKKHGPPAGDERDSETSFDHTWFRQYASTQGRWTTPDPAGLAAVDPNFPQSWNRYVYVQNNSVNFSDPSGMTPKRYACGGSGDPVTISGCSPLGGTIDGPGGGSSGNGLNAIFGNDIFDAISGTPGTYLSSDMYGNMSFGFSENLWSMTQNFLDANPYLRGSSGLQVIIQNSGVGQVISGLVPEYVALMQQQSQVLAAMPSRFAQDMAVGQGSLVAAGMDPNGAAGVALANEINLMQTYFASDPDARGWLNLWQNLSIGLIDWQSRWSSAFPYKP